MNYEFNNEYLTKSLISLVRDEGNRVVCADLATHDDVKSLVQPTLELAVEQGGQEVMDALATLHNGLSSVKLPGDFEKVSNNLKRRFGIAQEITKTEPEDDTIDYSTICAELESEYTLMKSAVIEKLSNLVYDLGSNGNHEAAYLIERKINEIKSIKNNF